MVRVTTSNDGSNASSVWWQRNLYGKDIAAIVTIKVANCSGNNGGCGSWPSASAFCLVFVPWSKTEMWHQRRSCLADGCEPCSKGLFDSGKDKSNDLADGIWRSCGGLDWRSSPQSVFVVSLEMDEAGKRCHQMDSKMDRQVGINVIYDQDLKALLQVSVKCDVGGHEVGAWGAEVGVCWERERDADFHARKHFFWEE